MRFQLAVTDIAPNYTGNILAVMNTVSSCAGFVTPIITAEIVDGNVGRAELRVEKMQLETKISICSKHLKVGVRCS